MKNKTICKYMLTTDKIEENTRKVMSNKIHTTGTNSGLKDVGLIYKSSNV